MTGSRILIFVFPYIISFCRGQDIFFAEPGQVKESDPCVTVSGANGDCRKPIQCPQLTGSKGSGKNSKLCGLDSKSELLVCCPALSEPITRGVTPPVENFDCGIRGSVRTGSFNTGALERRKRRAQESVQTSIFGSTLKNLAQKLNPIGVGFGPEIVGGRHSFRSSWPWMVLLGQGKANSGSEKPDFFCDAVLINERFVLTAAHCLLQPGDFFIRLGEHDYSTSNDGVTPLDVDVKPPVQFNPDYNVNRGYSDLALVELATNVTITNAVRPICLPWNETSNLDLVGKFMTVTGWGAENFGGQQSPILQEVTVQVFNASECEKNYSSLRDFKAKFPNGMTLDNILCAGDQSGGKDACQGDSGGPIVYQNSETGPYVLAGIVSKGYGCGLKDFPGLYAPIRNNQDLQWIKHTAFSS